MAVVLQAGFELVTPPDPERDLEEVVQFLDAAAATGLGLFWAAAIDSGWVFVPGVHGYPVAFPARPNALRPRQ